MLFWEQNEENGPRNWGPPSLLMEEGHPRMLNQLVRIEKIASDERERS